MDVTRDILVGNLVLVVTLLALTPFCAYRHKQMMWAHDDDDDDDDNDDNVGYDVDPGL